MAVGLQPFRDLDDIEANEVTHLHVRHALLSNEAPDVPIRGAQTTCEGRYVDEQRQVQLQLLRLRWRSAPVGGSILLTQRPQVRPLPLGHDTPFPIRRIICAAVPFVHLP